MYLDNLRLTLMSNMWSRWRNSCSDTSLFLHLYSVKVLYCYILCVSIHSYMHMYMSDDNADLCTDIISAASGSDILLIRVKHKLCIQPL